MPIYIYRCSTCHAVVERQRKIAEMDDPVTCVVCREMDSTDTKAEHSFHMERIMAAPAPHFPGSGSWRG
jgi:putative FmdB family regulatory protein